jgi:hypothetical protein
MRSFYLFHGTTLRLLKNRLMCPWDDASQGRSIPGCFVTMRPYFLGRLKHGAAYLTQYMYILYSGSYCFD